MQTIQQPFDTTQPPAEIIALSAQELWALLRNYLNITCQMFKSMPVFEDLSSEMGPKLRIQPFNIEVRWPLMANGQPGGNLELEILPQPEDEPVPERQVHPVSLSNPQGPAGAMLEAAGTLASMISQLSFWALLQNEMDAQQQAAPDAQQCGDPADHSLTSASGIILKS